MGYFEVQWAVALGYLAFQVEDSPGLSLWYRLGGSGFSRLEVLDAGSVWRPTILRVWDFGYRIFCFEAQDCD